MAVTLGKRKRRAEVDLTNHADSGEIEDEAVARALFQRAFEAKFKPLGNKVESIKSESTAVDISRDNDEHDDDDDELKEDEWSGLSDDGGKVEVVQIEIPDRTNSNDQRWEKKAFMSSKPPSSTTRKPTKSQAKAKESTDDENVSERANLKDDLALQRLLKESHLLDASTFHSADSSVQGKNRLKALDARVQDLGAKASHLEQTKMPLSHRRGIRAKSEVRERQRRVEAAANGVILERVKLAAKEKGRRERSVGGPSVGMLSGGTLRLSSRDVKGIEGGRKVERKDRRGRRG